jgi:hypothetical protein
MKVLDRLSFSFLTLIVAVAICAAQQAPLEQKTFASPDEAVRALRAAVYFHDKAALKEIFGPGIHDLLTGDEKQDKANSRKFAKAIDEGVKSIPEGGDKVILEIGNNKWPYPIPLVKVNSAWYFDTAAGKEEIINRHVGKDELHAIGVCEAYARQPSKIPGPKPFYGYFFKLLPRQGAPSAGDFTLEAYPEHWGRSGVMTFVVDNKDGKIYQRDLGEKTLELAAAMTANDPANSVWADVEDKGVIDK